MLNWWYIYLPLGYNGLNLSYKTSELLLYIEIIAVSSQIHTKPLNALYGQNVV